MSHIDKKIFFKAYITVEAAFIIPIFLFGVTLFINFFDVMDTHRKMQYIGESLSGEAAQVLYLNSIENKNEYIDEGIHKLFLREAGMISLIEKAKYDNHLDRVYSMIPFVYFDDEKQMINVRIMYKYRLMCGILGFDSIDQHIVSYRRYFTGTDSRRKDGKEDSIDEDDEWVYIGKTSTKYHISPSCHYLSNDLKQVNFRDISAVRNKNGGKYYPCASCAKGISKPSTVYIMKSGGVYHTTTECKAINAYVRKVKKSSVEYMGACSYCGR